RRSCEQLTLGGGDHTRQREMRRPGGQMRERAALHVYKRILARRMHQLKDEFMGIRSLEVKIVVIFSRQRADCRRHAENVLGNSRGNFGGKRGSDPRLWHHVEN